MSRPRLIPDELTALTTYAQTQGRYWKAHLRAAWESGNYQGQGELAPHLQTTRNKIGPSGLRDLKITWRKEDV